MSCRFLRDCQRWRPVLTRNFHSSPPSLKKKMPPKKAAAQEKKILLGRPSNNLKIGIVGPLSSFSWLLEPHPHHKDCQMSASLRSSTCYPTQVRLTSARSAPTNDPPCRSQTYPFPYRPLLNVLLELGKAFNYPFATIEPEVPLLYWTRLRSPPLTLAHRKLESPSPTHASIGFVTSTSLHLAFLPSSLVWTLLG